MDRLWFHQIVLFPEPSLFPSPELPKLPLPTSESSLCSSTNIIQDFSKQEALPAASLSSRSKDETSTQESDDHVHYNERPTRLKIVSSKSRSRSSSPILTKTQKIKYPIRRSRLQKSMSCRSLGELELEEVKGFMDLGFVFKKENLSKKIMSLIPGLQRVMNTYDEDEQKDNTIDSEDDDEEENGDQVKKDVIMRPYLSEAWLIRRPDSPLLNLRIPGVAKNSGDMKKHLKDWARTVALAIQQES